MSSGFVPFKNGPAQTGAPKPAAPNKLVPSDAKVESFQVRDLRKDTAPSYQAIRSSFDPSLASKNNRFVLSEHVANQLSVEQEDMLRFHKKVQTALDEKLAQLSESTRVNAQAEGYEAGRKQAYESEKANLVKQVELMGQAVASMVKAKELLASQYEKTLLEITFRLARLAVNYEIQHRPEAISATLVDILTRISKEDDVMIRLPADEFEAIDRIQAEIQQVARGGRVSFQVDQRLERGSCVVESLSGEISSSIEERFKRLEEEILGRDQMSRAKGA